MTPFRMASTARPADTAAGDGYRVLLVSDLHLENAYSDSMRSRLRNRIVPGWMDHYVDAYDCDELWVGGDVGDDIQDLAPVLTADVDHVRMVPGDEDDWYDPDIVEDGALHDEAVADALDGTAYDAGDVADHVCAPGLQWEVAVDGRTYTVAMTHTYDTFGLSSPKEGPDDYDRCPDRLDGTDVAIYGHGHQPWSRAICGTLVVGCGSTYSNYDMVAAFPEESVHIIEFGDEVRTRHLDRDAVSMSDVPGMDQDDLEDAEVFEQRRFKRNGNGFEELEPEHPLDVWPADRFLRS